MVGMGVMVNNGTPMHSSAPNSHAQPSSLSLLQVIVVAFSIINICFVIAN